MKFNRQLYFQWFYYFAIIEDLILRFGWAFLISLTETGMFIENTIVTVLAPLEVFRCYSSYYAFFIY